MSKMSVHVFKASSLALLSIAIASAIAPAQAAITQTCSIGAPKPGTISPLAMRAAFTWEEQDGKIVTVKYSPGPSPFNSQKPPVMFGSTRSLQFFDTNVAAVRALMLKDPQYFKALTDFPEGGSFKPFNDALVCKSEPVAKPVAATIDDLPNGDYRYWTGPASNTVTDQQILATGEGGGLFLFRKEGKKVVGIFARPDDVAMCVSGTLANGKVVGMAGPADRNAPFPRPADNSSYGAVGHLKFGTWKGNTKTGFSEGSTLDLTRFNPINLGTRKAPAACP
jgi:hypothetical protein